MGSKRKRLFMETTKIPARRTASQISEALADAGANAVLMEFAGGEIEAISFRLTVCGQDVPFRLPIRAEAILNILSARRIRARRDETAMHDQAARIAWRQILRWVEAQLALVQTNMVTADEVFMPYMQGAGGKTLYEVAAEGGFRKLLAPPKEKGASYARRARSANDD